MSEHTQLTHRRMRSEPVHTLTNTHDQLVAAGGGIAIMHTAHTSAGRGGGLGGWHIYRVDGRGLQINTEFYGHWANHGQKFFGLLEHHRGESSAHDARAAALAEAIAWVAATYPAYARTVWVANRYRDRIPIEVKRAHPLTPQRKKSL